MKRAHKPNNKPLVTLLFLFVTLIPWVSVKSQVTNGVFDPSKARSSERAKQLQEMELLISRANDFNRTLGTPDHPGSSIAAPSVPAPLSALKVPSAPAPTYEVQQSFPPPKRIRNRPKPAPVTIAEPTFEEAEPESDLPPVKPRIWTPFSLFDSYPESTDRERGFRETRFAFPKLNDIAAWNPFVSYPGTSRPEPRVRLPWNPFQSYPDSTDRTLETNNRLPWNPFESYPESTDRAAPRGERTGGRAVWNPFQSYPDDVNRSAPRERASGGGLPGWNPFQSYPDSTDRVENPDRIASAPRGDRNGWNPFQSYPDNTDRGEAPDRIASSPQAGGVGLPSWNPFESFPDTDREPRSDGSTRVINTPRQPRNLFGSFPSSPQRNNKIAQNPFINLPEPPPIVAEANRYPTRQSRSQNLGSGGWNPFQSYPEAGRIAKTNETPTSPSSSTQNNTQGEVINNPQTAPLLETTEIEQGAQTGTGIFLPEPADPIEAPSPPQ